MVYTQLGILTILCVSMFFQRIMLDRYIPGCRIHETFVHDRPRALSLGRCFEVLFMTSHRLVCSTSTTCLASLRRHWRCRRGTSVTTRETSPS
ncbi:hypothetical protein ARMGADRAFT_478810 [Armillaria gallica]|uniref:Uncharacterized protein n=1 Tax=Armillaria gallica TaxID=47427 RepID=A0A2H3CUK6_ARMGA|nr:hypothetical protein ARMGADRAFT_478810 [Armillaria gallica]